MYSKQSVNEQHVSLNMTDAAHVLCIYASWYAQFASFNLKKIVLRIVLAFWEIRFTMKNDILHKHAIVPKLKISIVF